MRDPQSAIPLTPSAFCAGSTQSRPTGLSPPRAFQGAATSYSPFTKSPAAGRCSSPFQRMRQSETAATEEKFRLTNHRFSPTRADSYQVTCTCAPLTFPNTASTQISPYRESRRKNGFPVKMPWLRLESVEGSTFTATDVSAAPADSVSSATRSGPSARSDMAPLKDTRHATSKNLFIPTGMIRFYLRNCAYPA